MWTAFGIQALLGHTQALHWPSAYEVLFDDRRGIIGPYVAVPYRFGINHHHGTVFALVEASGFVDPHPGSEPSRLGQLLQTGVQIALSIHGAGGPRRISGTGVVADKDVAFKCGQATILLDAGESRLKPHPWSSSLPAAKFPQS
jgi:hypothetical protein